MIGWKGELLLKNLLVLCLCCFYQILLKVYVYFLEEVFAECMLDARAECWRDASDDVPKVGKVGMIAEDVDPHLSR